MIRNQLPVEAAVLDENFAGAGAGYDDSGDVDSGDVGFQGRGIADGAELFGGKFDADAAQEIVIGMVSGEPEDKIVGQANRAGWSFQDHAIFVDLAHGAVEVRDNLAGLAAVFDVGAHPIFDVVVYLPSAMNQRGARPEPHQID